jgi:hypothetical protein
VKEFSPIDLSAKFGRFSTRQGQPKKYISAQRDMMDLKGGLFVFETKMTLDRS